MHCEVCVAPGQDPWRADAGDGLRGRAWVQLCGEPRRWVPVHLEPLRPAGLRELSRKTAQRSCRCCQRSVALGKPIFAPCDLATRAFRVVFHSPRRFALGFLKSASSEDSGSLAFDSPVARASCLQVGAQGTAAGLDQPLARGDVAAAGFRAALCWSAERPSALQSSEI